MYFTPKLVCTLWSMASRILSEFSLAMNAVYRLCIAFRFSWTLCEVGFIDSKVAHLAGWLVAWDWD